MTIGAGNRLDSSAVPGGIAYCWSCIGRPLPRSTRSTMKEQKGHSQFTRPQVALLFAFLATGCSGSADPEGGIAKLESAIAASANEAVLGFEDPSAWHVTPGSIASAATDPTATEGAASLAVHPSGFAVLTSQPFPVLSAITGPVSYDLFVPSEQANPYWFGATQLYANCPSRGV